MWVAILGQDNADIYGIGCFGAIVLIGIFIAIFAKAGEKKEADRRSALPQAEREALEREERDLAQDQEFGPKNEAMVCPHCQSKGAVRIKRVKQKQGISGGKATAALLTGGASLVAVGLSKKGEVTQAMCENCQCQWTF
jgi:hypothetical protein